MSVKRFDIDDVEETGWSMNEYPDGPWVKFEDYAALEAELTLLREIMFSGLGPFLFVGTL